jgi:hypothetical protein
MSREPNRRRELAADRSAREVNFTPCDHCPTTKLLVDADRNVLRVFGWWRVDPHYMPEGPDNPFHDDVTPEYDASIRAEYAEHTRWLRGLAR